MLAGTAGGLLGGPGGSAAAVGAWEGIYSYALGEPIETALTNGVVAGATDFAFGKAFEAGGAIIGAGVRKAAAKFATKQLQMFGEAELKALERGAPVRYVYRGLAATDDISVGIFARVPEAEADVASHVAGLRKSPFISTTKDFLTAQRKYNKHGYGVIRIDLTKVKGEIIDISNGIPGKRGRLSNYARADREVLIRGYIPPGAIEGVR